MSDKCDGPLLAIEDIVSIPVESIIRFTAIDERGIEIFKAMLAGEWECEKCKHGEKSDAFREVFWGCEYTVDSPWFKACSNWEPGVAE